MIVCLFTIPLNPDAGSPIADFMDGNATQWKTMISNLIADSPNKLRLMNDENALRMVPSRGMGYTSIPNKAYSG